MALLAGLDENTPIGKIASLRTETDKEVIKHFTPEQKAERRRWKDKYWTNLKKNMSDEEIKELYLKNGYR